MIVFSVDLHRTASGVLHSANVSIESGSWRARNWAGHSSLHEQLRTTLLHDGIMPQYTIPACLQTFSMVGRPTANARLSSDDDVEWSQLDESER
jgi:hypothetical protein